MSLAAPPVRAQSIGHYAPGSMGILDYFIGDRDTWLDFYHYYYVTSRINDQRGKKITSVTLAAESGPGVTVSVDVHAGYYSLSPTISWVSPWHLAGATVAAYVAPELGTSNQQVTLHSVTRGGTLKSNGIGNGDPFLQPLWLDWSLAHWDLSIGEGVYFPLGRYGTETLELPVIGPITVESPDNIGLGFWENQLQGAAAWYPRSDQATAVVSVLTWEVNGTQRGFDTRPGQLLTLNWGVSQDLNPGDDQKFSATIALVGYDTWQVTDDSGAGAASPSPRTQLHAVGGQVGLEYAPWQLSVEFHALDEYAARSRPQGASYTLVIGLKL